MDPNTIQTVCQTLFGITCVVAMAAMVIFDVRKK